MAYKPTEATRDPSTAHLQGPVQGDPNYIRSGSRVPPGGFSRAVAPKSEEVEPEAEDAKAVKKDAKDA